MFPRVVPLPKQSTGSPERSPGRAVAPAVACAARPGCHRHPEQRHGALAGVRWADRLGVCANLSVRFPSTFLWEMSRAVLRRLPSTSSFDKPILSWRLMKLLRELEETAQFAGLRAYLGKRRRRFPPYELSCRIADCFDQYLVYRPDWIEKWEAGEDEDWQAELWRRLVRNGEAHRGAGPAPVPRGRSRAMRRAATCRNGSPLSAWLRCRRCIWICWRLWPACWMCTCSCSIPAGSIGAIFKPSAIWPGWMRISIPTTLSDGRSSAAGFARQAGPRLHRPGADLSGYGVGWLRRTGGR